nr:hypothetical protein [Pirellula staleyi]
MAGVLATAAGLGVGAGEFFRELLVLDAVYGLMTGEFSLEFTGEFEAGRNWFSAPKRSEPVRKLPAHSEAARTRFHRCDIPPRRISNDRDIAVPPVVLISPASAAALDTGELFAAPLALALTIALHPC